VLPALGLEGAGVALLMANFAALCITLSWLHRALSFSVFSTLRYGKSVRRTIELAKVGIPMAGTVLVKFGVLGVVALGAVRAGTDAAASHSIATSLVGLTFTAAVAVGQAGIPLVSSRATTHDVAGIRRAVIAGTIVAGTVVSALCLALVLFDDQIVRGFSTDPQVISLLSTLMPLVALAITADGLQAVFGFGLTGLKRSGASFIVFSVLYGMLAVIALPVAEEFGLVGLWAALAAINGCLIAGQAGALWRATNALAAESPMPA
jgi:MATE family multidrug resistance protein